MATATTAATAAIAVAHQLGVSDDVIRQAMAGFGGVKRRFTKTGETNGITVIDDYGHHPVEIAAVLKAARESTDGKIIAVVQPHRYTRLQSLFEEFCTCFNDADAVVVAEVYPAGEAPIAGVDRDHFAAGLRARHIQLRRRIVLLVDADQLRQALGDATGGVDDGLDDTAVAGGNGEARWFHRLLQRKVRCRRPLQCQLRTQCKSPRRVPRTSPQHTASQSRCRHTSDQPDTLRTRGSTTALARPSRTQWQRCTPARCGIHGRSCP